MNVTSLQRHVGIPQVVMSTLDCIFIGLVCDLLLAARDEVQDGVHPATSRGTRLGRLVCCNDCWVRTRILYGNSDWHAQSQI